MIKQIFIEIFTQKKRINFKKKFKFAGRSHVARWPSLAVPKDYNLSYQNVYMRPKTLIFIIQFLKKIRKKDMLYNYFLTGPYYLYCSITIH